MNEYLDILVYLGKYFIFVQDLLYHWWVYPPILADGTCMAMKSVSVYVAFF